MSQISGRATCSESRPIFFRALYFIDKNKSKAASDKSWRPKPKKPKLLEPPAPRIRELTPDLELAPWQTLLGVRGGGDSILENFTHTKFLN